MNRNEEYFHFFYEGTKFTIQKEHKGKYVFKASISLDARQLAEPDDPVECTRETLEKAVDLTKQKGFERLKDQISFDPFWQEWRIGLKYPYFHLEYSLSEETYSFHADYGYDFANIPVYSPAFPVVMTLLHELAVLYQGAKRDASEKRAVSKEIIKPRNKVLCPFCSKKIRPMTAYCGFCGESLSGIRSFIPTREEVDFDETIFLCRFCGNDVSWNEVFCRHCGKRLRD